jgi:hypothetical protein
VEPFFAAITMRERLDTVSAWMRSFAARITEAASRAAAVARATRTLTARQ